MEAASTADNPTTQSAVCPIIPVANPAAAATPARPPWDTARVMTKRISGPGVTPSTAETAINAIKDEASGMPFADRYFASQPPSITSV